jgi:tRNA G10  N-methylase Trm11
VVQRIVVVLRNNIELRTDLDLAAREATALAGVPAKPIADVESAVAECIGIRQESVSAVLGRPLKLRLDAPRGLLLHDVDDSGFDRLVRRSAFAQEIFVAQSAPVAPSTLSAACGDGSVGFALHAFLETLDGLLPWLRKQRDHAAAISAVRDHLLGGELPPGLSGVAVEKALTRRGTLHLAHDLHVYKAKFFPRLVGALLNIYGPAAGGVLVEPFAGSGTALFEAALRGIRSFGFDIDPISAMISAAKVEPLRAPPEQLEHLAASVLGAIDVDQMRNEVAPLRLPDDIRRRLLAKDAREGTRYVAEIESDAGRIKAAIEQYEGAERLLLNTLFSDALTKKVRYRFVGVGNGRYTFAVTKEPVLTRFRKKVLDLGLIAAVLRWVESNVAELAPSAASIGDARALPLADASVDIVLTSPPYLPASSGREHYALARAIPLAWIQAGNAAELEALDRRALGAVPQCDCPPDPILHAPLDHLDTCELATPAAVDQQQFPAHAVDLLQFLARDPQRRLKHRPTLQYLDAIDQSLRECLRVLKPTGRLLMVLPRESIFYESQTRETLFVCRTAELVAQIGASVGYEVEDAVDMELLKRGTPNARPRALDAYFERVIVLRAPAERGAVAEARELAAA